MTANIPALHPLQREVVRKIDKGTLRTLREVYVYVLTSMMDSIHINMSFYQRDQWKTEFLIALENKDLIDDALAEEE